MSIDPSIPLQIRPVPLSSVLDSYQQILELQNLKSAGEERRATRAEKDAKRQREAQIDEVFQASITIDPVTQQPVFDYAKALGHKLPAATLFEVKKQFDDNAERMAGLQTANLTAEEKKATYLGGVARGISASGHDPDAARLAIVGAKKIGALSEAEEDALLNAVDREGPAAVKRWVDGALARAGGTETAGFTLSPGQVRYGPGGQQIAAGPPRDGTTADQFTLSPGSVRFGAGGEQIAAVPPAPPAPRDERLVQVIGPEGRPVWVRESQAVGKPAGAGPGGEGGIKLSAAQQEDVATMLTVQDLGKEAVTLGDRIKWRGVGPVAGRAGELGARYLGVGGEEPERLRNLLGNIQGTIAKLRGGASFTPSEQVMLDRYTPTTTDSVLQIKAKLNSLSDFITTKRENTLRVAGGQYTPRDTTATSGPTVGERRTIKGQLAEWDGRGWKAVR